MSYTKQLQEISNKFFEATGKMKAKKKDIATWAIREGLWYPHPSSLVKQCAEELAKAMREEYITDAQGRRVRAKIAVTLEEEGKQQSFWADVRNASRDLVESGFKQKRSGIVGDCFQLKMDVDSFNENYNDGQAIQLPLDFSDDVAEKEIEMKMAQKKKAA